MIVKVGSLNLPDEIMRKYPKNADSCDEWLSYLDEIERYLRFHERKSKATGILLKLYEGACSTLPEDWTSEAYWIVFIRKTVLALHENDEEGQLSLRLASFNARSNPQVVTAVAYYYNQNGQKSKALSLINTSKKKMDHDGVLLLQKVERFLLIDEDFKELLGPFYYQLDFADSSVSRVDVATEPKPSNINVSVLNMDGNEILESSLNSRLVTEDTNGTVDELIDAESDRTRPEFSANKTTDTDDTLGCSSTYRNKNGTRLDIDTQTVNCHLDFKNLVVNNEIYYILGELGRGGSSVVHSVLDSKLNTWALKEVNLRDAPTEVVHSYLNEIEMLRCLSDSGRVIRLHDYEHKPEHLLLVLERAHTDLRKVLVKFMEDGQTRKCGRMPALAVTFYWDQMLHCVKALHDRRIIHLDLKPHNFVLIDGELKLIDLGTSQRLPDDSTCVLQSLKLGTLSFMSPEQLEESCVPASNRSLLLSPKAAPDVRFKVGRKSDIWSLGVILYIMVYSKYPFNQPTVKSRLIAILNPNLDIDFPLIENPAIHKALKRSLVRDFKDRATVEELLNYKYDAGTNLNLLPSAEFEAST